MGHKPLIYSGLCSLHDALNSCRCCEGHYTSPRSQQGRPAGHVSFVGSREVDGSDRNLFVYLLSEALWTLEGKLTQAGKHECLEVGNYGVGDTGMGAIRVSRLGRN